MYKNLYRLGFVAYLALFILSVIFFKERTIFVDIALHLWDIITNGTFTIQAFRYGAVMTEIFPLVASKAGIPLQGVMMAYSVGFIAYYTICYVICGSVFKNYRLALGLLLFNILFASDTFFWMQSELPQGVAFSFCLFAYISNKRTSEVGAIGLGFLFFGIVTAVFFHSLMMLVLLYMVVFLLLQKENIIERKWLYSVLFFAVGIFLLKKYVFINAYEQNAMKGAENFKTLYPDYFSLYSFKRFWADCVSKYHWLILLFLSVLTYYIVKKEWLKLLLVFFAATGYLLLVNVSHWYESVQQFYIENLYLPLGVIVGLPFVYDVLQFFERKKLVAIGLVSVIIITCVIRIVSTSQTYTKRLNWEREYLKEHGHEKLIVSDRHAPLDTLLMTWGTPYEFWLLSTIETGKTASIIFSANMEPVSWAISDKQFFITQFAVPKYATLPSKYFKLTDTSTAYRVVK